MPKFFSNDINFSQVLRNITIENHIFSKELNFKVAIFARTIGFRNCRFKSSINFYGANFEGGAILLDSIFSEKVQFGQAQFRVASIFKGVTFCGEVNFYSQPTDDNFAAIFREAIFKKMIPVFHGRNFHPACDFHGVTWPDIPKRNGQKKTEDTIEDALLHQITS